MADAPPAGTSPSDLRESLAPVLELLHARQQAAGFIDASTIAEVASVAGLSPTELYGAVTAYPRFRTSAGPPPALVCGGPACRLRGATRAQANVDAAGETHCLGLCDQPVAVLTDEGPKIAPDGDASTLVAPTTPRPIVGVPESAFFGDDDPFDAVGRARSLPPGDLIAAVTESGLEGRGGAGFPAGHKWAAVRAAAGDARYVVCNADESEPGSFKDRAILDHQPRRLLAGMAIAAHAVSATAGVVYIRHEYRRQYERLRDEIARLREEGYLGDAFDIVVRRGAGSYVCGEETALLNSLEGRRPIPRDRPPYPVSHGLHGAPTLVQNVETLAAAPSIVARGAAWYRDTGRPKLYCVSGDVPSPGVLELPMTVTARDVLERAGVRAPEVKAFTLGGMSGGLLPTTALDVRLDFDGPRRFDAFLGSGAIIALGRQRCPVRFAMEALRFFSGESCGKCFPCRIGTTRLLERLDAATGFKSVDAAEMADIVDLLTVGSACGLGPAAGLIVRHLLANFGGELRAHADGRCPTGECEGA